MLTAESRSDAAKNTTGVMTPDAPPLIFTMANANWVFVPLPSVPAAISNVQTELSNLLAKGLPNGDEVPVTMVTTWSEFGLNSRSTWTPVNVWPLGSTLISKVNG